MTIQTNKPAVRRRAAAPNCDQDTGSVFNLRKRLEENFSRVEEILTKLESGETQDKLVVASELKQHIAAEQKMLETALRAEAVEAFQQAVLAAQEKASATVRKRVIEALRASELAAAGVLTPRR